MWSARALLQELPQQEARRPAPQCAEPRTRPWNATKEPSSPQPAQQRQGSCESCHCRGSPGRPGHRAGYFLVNSTPATVLFDSGATHSFVTQSFALESGMTPTPLNSPMVVQTSGAEMRTKIGCKGVGIVINGVNFQADLIILRSQGLDVILGMDWLFKHQGLLYCASRTVTVTNDHGVEVKFAPNPSSAQGTQVNCLSEVGLEQVPVV